MNRCRSHTEPNWRIRCIFRSGHTTPHMALVKPRKQDKPEYILAVPFFFNLFARKRVMIHWEGGIYR